MQAALVYNVSMKEKNLSSWNKITGMDFSNIDLQTVIKLEILSLYIVRNKISISSQFIPRRRLSIPNTVRIHFNKK